MRVAVMFSGGKDSTFAVHWAYLHGFEVAILLSVLPVRGDSWMFHRPMVVYTELQAEAMGFRHMLVRVSGVKEREVEELARVLRVVRDEFGVEGIVLGALLSDYQRMRVALVSEELGLKMFVPQWGVNQAEYMRMLARCGFEILVVSVTAYGIPLDLVGKVLSVDDVEMLIRLSRIHGFNPAFEGGEAETFVVDAPLFRKRVCVEGEVVRVSSFEAYLRPGKVWLEEKRLEHRSPQKL